MKALTWQGKRKVSVETVPDPEIHAICDATDGRGPDGVVDADGLLPDALAAPLMEKTGVDRLAALPSSLDLVRRGGAVSLSGVYGGQADPMPMLTLFDKPIQLRAGQCNVTAWIDDLLPLVEDPADALGVDDLVTHRAPRDQAPAAYETFQKKEDNCIKVVLDPKEQS